MIGRRLNFEIDTELETSLVTPLAGIASLIEAYRLSGTAAVIDRTVKIEMRKRAGWRRMRWWRASWRCGRQVENARKTSNTSARMQRSPS